MSETIHQFVHKIPIKMKFYINVFVFDVFFWNIIKFFEILFDFYYNFRRGSQLTHGFMHYVFWKILVYVLAVSHL